MPKNDPDAGPMLSSRRAGLLVGLGGVRALVEKGRALLFGPRSRVSRLEMAEIERNARIASGKKARNLMLLGVPWLF